MNKLGFIYFKGEGLPQDLNKAKELFKRSKTLGNDLADNMIKYIDSRMTSGIIIPYSDRTNYSILVRRDFARALFNLRRSMYENIDTYIARQEYEKLQIELELRGVEI